MATDASALQARSESRMWVGIMLALALGVIGTTYVGGNALTKAHEQGTQRIEACVQNGGTWIEGYSMCIQNGQEIK